MNVPDVKCNENPFVERRIVAWWQRQNTKRIVAFRNLPPLHRNPQCGVSARLFECLSGQTPPHVHAAVTVLFPV